MSGRCQKKNVYICIFLDQVHDSHIWGQGYQSSGNENHEGVHER